MRLFVAVGLSDAVRQRLADTISRLKPELGRISWVPPDNMHITLKFLGEVPDNRISRVSDALAQARSGSSTIALQSQGLGCFPDPAKARVLWAGLSGAVDQLAELQTSLDSALAEEGFPRERRAFSPHITLARIRRPLAADRLSAVLEQHENMHFGDWRVKEYLLMESILGKGRARYHVAARYGL